MTPVAVQNWPHDDPSRQRAMATHHQYPRPHPPPPRSRSQDPYYAQPPNGRSRQPVMPRGAPYGAVLPPGPGPAGGYGYGGPSGPGSVPATPTTPSMPLMPTPISPPNSDTLPTFMNGDLRSSPKSSRHPPPTLPHIQQPAPSRWDSLPSATASPPGLGSPTSPRFTSHSAAGSVAPKMRSRPTTPAAYDVNGGFDSHSEPPSRPLTAKSSFPDMRHSQEANSDIGNFSRPRNASIRQPVSDTPSRRPTLLPTPSEEGPEMFHNALPSPFGRPRRPSISSNVSSSTWASGMSPTTGEFTDIRNGGYRMRNVGPPPVSATRPPFGYNNRMDSSGSAPTIGGAAPWVSGDELRSSFRSQLTASSAPGTANTERSSVLTKDSSATSFDANNDYDADPDEPSLEDVMGMYEEGFEDDDEHHDQQPADQRSDRDADDEADFSSRPTTTVTTVSDLPPPQIGVSDVDDQHLPPPMPMASRLDAEIRQSKMMFSSPDFLASLPHLAAQDDDNDEDKRDSGKSLESDPSETSQPTITRPGTIANSSPPSAAETLREDSPSPIMDGSAIRAEPSPVASQPAPSSAPTQPVEAEIPGSRDRYGFKKETQHVTQKQYEKWDQGYSEYLARRKKKWTAFLKDNALMTDQPNRFPAASPKTKKFIRKGIPPEWRGAAWFYYAGGPAILAKHGGLYSKLLQHKAKRIDVEAIERDLHRTFPDNISFRPPGTSQASSGQDAIAEDDTVQPKPEEPEIISSLRRVLFAFSIYNPSIGYCQSLNFIAGLLLLFVDTEEQCFWLLNVITHIYLPGTHEMSLEGSKVDLSVLMTEIRDTMPAVWDKIGGELEGPSSRPSTSKSIRRPKFRRKEQGSLPTERLPPITLCMTAWFMSCFIGTLPIETTLRVWDVFFYEGSKTLFRMALAIFKTGESEILRVSDPMEIFGVVQSMPRKMIDANALMEACFKRRNGFGHLSQGTIDERRQERRTAQHTTREGRGSKVGSGNVTEGEPQVRRRGTLFSRKKKRDPSRPRAAEV